MKPDKIKKHLTTHPSYFKWSVKRLAEKYNCSEILMGNILKNLGENKNNYKEALKF
jgi:hypothetical protein